MQIPPSSNLIAALSALTPATRTPPAPTAAQPPFTPTIAGRPASIDPVTPAAKPAGQTAAAAPKTEAAPARQKYSPLGRIVDIRV